MKTTIKYEIMAGVLLVCAAGLVSAGILLHWTEATPQFYQQTNHFSFEQGLEGWEPNGTDLFDPPVNWSIAPSQESAANGNSSLKLYLDNMNDAGKIWVEHIFNVNPSASYHVQVSYKFGTMDIGDFNLFTIITTVLNQSHASSDELMYQGDTGHHTEAEGLHWLNKTYDFIVNTDQAGVIYTNIGVWGSWETSRTYYLDDVSIVISELDSTE